MSSEFDPRSGRKGFVRDVMRRISAAPPEGDPVEPGDGEPGAVPGVRSCRGADLQSAFSALG